MSYKSEIYIKARSELNRRRKEAEASQQQRRLAAVSKCPEIEALEREMAHFGSEAVKLACGGGDDLDVRLAALAQKSEEVQQRRKQLLVDAGFGADYLDTKYFCPICSDTGSHDGYYCSCYMQLVRDIAREQIAPKQLLEQSSFDNFDLRFFSDENGEFSVSPREQMEHVKSSCLSFASEFSKTTQSGIFLFGKTGLGKTHLCLAIADEVTKKGYNVCYVSAQNAMNALEREHFGRESGQNDLLDELCTADLLVLDDLGAEFSTSFTVSQIYNILNTRIVDCLPTVISTNLDLAEIESKYSQRVASRILGSFKLLQCIGADIRIEKLTGKGKV